MKNLFTILIALIICAPLTFAQKFTKQAFAIDYIRLPLTPLPNNVTKYSSAIVLNYADRVKQEKDMYDKEQQDAKDQAAADKAAYAEKSVGKRMAERALLGDKKPGEAKVIETPYFATIYNADALSATYLKIPGCDKGTDNAVVLTAHLDGFSYTEISEITKTKSKKSGSETIKINVYAYEISHKHPIRIQVAGANGVSIHDGYMDGTMEYTKSTTNWYESTKQLKKYWATNWKSFMRSLDENQTNANMGMIQDFLADNFGYTPMTRNTFINLAKGKKYDFEDFQTAYEKVATGYNLLKEEPDAVAAELKEAIRIWEIAIAEYSPKAKKIRMSKKLTSATYLNTIEAYIWLNEYNKAKDLINKLNIVNPSYKARGKILRGFLDDQKARYDAKI